MSIIQKATKKIGEGRRKNKLLIAAGAGMGKDSGMPDFRGPEGFWKNYPPFRNKFDFYQCANPLFLEEHPHHFWGFYGHRLNMYRQVTPHRGFQILRNIAESLMQDYFVFTSNVDGHFSKLFPQQKIYEVHGSIHHLQCFSCQTIYPNNFQPQVDETTMRCENLPKCPGCEQTVRPNILMFNDWEWISDRSDLQAKNFRKFLAKNNPEEEQLIIIQIGCGAAVATVRNICQQLFYNNKKSTLIRINPDLEVGGEIWQKNQRFLHVCEDALEALLKIQSKLKQENQK